MLCALEVSEFLPGIPYLADSPVDDSSGNALVDHLIWIHSFYSGGLKRLRDQLKTPEESSGSQASGVFTYQIASSWRGFCSLASEGTRVSRHQSKTPILFA